MEEERLLQLSSASNSRQMLIENPIETATVVDASQQMQLQGNNTQTNDIERSEEINGSSNAQASSQSGLKSNEPHQVAQSASECYWQSKKHSFVEEMNKLIIQGIDLSNQLLYPMNEEILTQKINEAKEFIQDESKTDQVAEYEKKLIKELCLWLIEGQNCSEFDLIRLSTVIKEFAEQNLQQIPSILQKNIDYYRDIIAECAEKKNYGLKLTKDISTILLKHQNSLLPADEQINTLRIGLHDIWEIKEIQSLCYNVKIEEIDFIRKKRRQHSALLKGLEKLIKAIEKGKGEDEAFSAYQKIAMNPPKMKVQTKINGKGNTQKAGQVDKNIEDNLKKMKIDSGNTTPIKQGEAEGEEIGSEVKAKKKAQKRQNGSKKGKGEEGNGINNISTENPNQEVDMQDTNNKSLCESSVINSINPEQAKQSVAKKNPIEQKKNAVQQTPATIPKDNSQKKLFSFFKKNNNLNTSQDQDPLNQSFSNQINKEKTTNIENVNPETNSNAIVISGEINQIPAKPAKSILRKIGCADPRPQHLQTSEKIQNTIQTEQVFSIIKQESKQQWSLLKKGKRAAIQNSQMMQKSLSKMSEKNRNRRRILVVIHDYVRQYKFSYFDQKSKIINPRNFLIRDDDLIQYDLDSEDELQELNAENIENEEDDMDEEDLEDDDSAKQFIVPDGYLSDEGFDSDKEDVFNQKKLTFQNYNFTENGNKQGFIFQEKDKAGDVQNFLINYRAKKYDESETFPLCLKKKQNGNQEEQAQAAAPIVWTNERLKQYTRVVHGSYQPKKTLLEQIAKIDIMKEVSKNRLEKKFKEITLKDDKQEGEALKRWLVHSAVLESLEFEENEMDELKKQRQEEYKSTRQTKKEEKPTSTSSQPNQANSQVIQTNNQVQGVQQQIKPIIGYNIFSSAAPLKKNVNITPIKSMIKSDDEDEEVRQAEEKQKIRIQEEQQKMEQEQKIIVIQQQIPKAEQSNNICEYKQSKLNGIFEENSQNGMSQSFEQRNNSRKNSTNMNENSNTSVKKNSLKQTTISFGFKKS